MPRPAYVLPVAGQLLEETWPGPIVELTRPLPQRLGCCTEPAQDVEEPDPKT